MTGFDVTCPYCDCMFSLSEDGDYPQELFDDGGYIERKCPDVDCGKNIHIKIAVRWKYTPDMYESDTINK